MSMIKFKTRLGSTVIFNKEMVISCFIYKNIIDIHCVLIRLKEGIVIEHEISFETALELENLLMKE